MAPPKITETKQKTTTNIYADGFNIHYVEVPVTLLNSEDPYQRLHAAKALALEALRDHFRHVYRTRNQAKNHELEVYLLHELDVELDYTITNQTTPLLVFKEC